MKVPRILALALLLGAATVGAGAFTMEPMSALLAPSGAGSVATFRIRNEGTSRVALRLSVHSRSLSEGGEEVNGPAGNLFALFPSRLLLDPGATAAAKVQWRGARSLDSELAFRFVAEEVAIDSLSSRSSGIRVRFRYVASLYVGEAGFKPDLQARVEGAEDPSGGRGFLVEMSNAGTRHVVALDAKIEIPGLDGTLLSSEELGRLSGANYLPGDSRRLFVPRAEAQVGKRYDARIDFESDF
jgi:fimbrial chaperone protein